MLAAAHLPDGHAQKRFSPYVRDGLHMNKSVPFQDTKDRDLAGGAMPRCLHVCRRNRIRQVPPRRLEAFVHRVHGP